MNRHLAKVGRTWADTDDEDLEALRIGSTNGFEGRGHVVGVVRLAHAAIRVPVGCKQDGPRVAVAALIAAAVGV